MSAALSAAHVEVADLAVGDRRPSSPRSSTVVARHRRAGGAVAHGAGAVGQEDVQHLGRADAVEDVDSRSARVKRSPISRGSASPADTHRRSAATRARAAVGAASMPRRASARRRTPSAAASTMRLNTASASAARPSARRSRPPTAERSARCRAHTRRRAWPPRTRRRPSATARARSARTSVGVQYRLACVCTAALGAPGGARRIEPEGDVVGARVGRLRLRCRGARGGRRTIVRIGGAVRR